MALTRDVVSAPIAAADWLRRRWLRLLGPLARPIVTDRELRVALGFSAMILSALVATLVAPLWMLILGPLVWGVPHLVADLRYLVVRPGYHRRGLLCLVAGGPLLWVGLGGELWWGFLGAGAAALLARARLLPRLLVVISMLACGVGLAWLGRLGDVIFAHAHNFIAVGLWWSWRPRVSRLHWIPLALLVLAGMFLLGDVALGLAQASGGLAWFGGRMSLDYQMWRLSPGVAPELGLRLVLLFCFAQTIHYAVWLQLLPDEDRGRATPTSFRASHQALRRDLGDLGLGLAVLLALGLAGWAVFDLLHASHGYFRVARFHGHLELIAGALLLLERRRD
ncbi:MAG: hypothetical protein H0T76_03465 [Nannocystis sp.]|nr:hypothetical protein [Nannocystis sp.]MBA3545521.1 hypothetical protein [Nannocystis sp.]